MSNFNHLKSNQFTFAVDITWTKDYFSFHFPQFRSRYEEIRMRKQRDQVERSSNVSSQPLLMPCDSRGYRLQRPLGDSQLRTKVTRGRGKDLGERRSRQTGLENQSQTNQLFDVYLQLRTYISISEERLLKVPESTLVILLSLRNLLMKWNDSKLLKSSSFN